jgi:Carboxypeptidase regulatory-like domain
MYRAILRTVFLAGSLLLTSSCHTKQEGSVEGSVIPPSPGVRVTISQSGKTVSAIEADKKDGTFRVALAPGRYDISVIAPSSPFPVNFQSVSVDPGKTASLPPVRLAQLSGTASLSGTVLPVGRNIRVTLLSEGQERATINASPEGKYEFTALSPGNYTLQATAPGYAGDRVAVQIAEDHPASQNMRLLYVTPIDGIDWGHEVIRAKGKGIYPANVGNRTAMHEMAKRAALTVAERNLLLAAEQIKLDPEHDLKSIMTGSIFAVRISGFLKGYKIVGERDVDNGVEVELELPLTGPGGLTGYISN